MGVNKKMLLAGALCAVVIVVAMVVNKRYFARPEPQPSAQAAPAEDMAEPAPIEAAPSWAASTETEGVAARDITIETDVYVLTFSSRGGVLQQVELKRYPDRDGYPVRMIAEDTAGNLPLLLRFDSPDSPEASPIPVYAYSSSSTRDRIEFSLTAVDEKGNRFLVRKTFHIDPSAYLIRLEVTVEGEGGKVPYNMGEFLYTLSFGPQIGPLDTPADGKNEYRYFTTYTQNQERNLQAKPGSFQEVSEISPWIGTEGKYFAALVLPDDPTSVKYAVKAEENAGTGRLNSFFIGMIDPQVSTIREGYTVFIGPKDKKILQAMEQHEWIADKNAPISTLVKGSRALGWLNTAIAFILAMLYRVIPNYGIGIIIFGILIKLALVPISQPLYIFHAKMKKLRPEILAINKRFAGRTGELNEALSELFKRENIKTKSSILLLVIQLPLFVSLYTLLGTQIQFRLASFIPGWIPDLTLPDVLWSFAPHSIPVLGWQALRLLPLIFLAILLIESRFTQSPIAGSRSMNFMSIFMPVFIFFILYDLPSGLVLFFIVEYGLNLLHQILVTRKFTAG